MIACGSGGGKRGGDVVSCPFTMSKKQEKTMPSVTEAQVYEALAECYDPEIPMVSIVDLGLVYELDIDKANNVDVKMTLTARGCPMHASISQMVKDNVERLVEGVGEVRVEIVWEPAWTKDMVTPEGKKKLGMA